MPARRAPRDRSAATPTPAPAGGAVPSPCTGVCRIDPRTALCAGCLRSLDEIAAWPTLDDPARLALRRALRARRAAAVEAPSAGAAAGPGAADAP